MTESNKYDPALNIRVRYFDGQFLQSKDFEDEQTYHIKHQQLANRLLRVQGICEGLEIGFSDNKITVKPGVAVDKQGQFIVLTEQQIIGNISTSEQKVYVYILSRKMPAEKFQPENDFQPQGGDNKGAVRWNQEPKVDVVIVSKSESKVLANSVMLGEIDITNNKVINRNYSGIRLSSFDRENSLVLSSSQEDPKVAVLRGSLTIEQNLTVKGFLQVGINPIIRGFSSKFENKVNRQEYVPTIGAVEEYTSGQIKTIDEKWRNLIDKKAEKEGNSKVDFTVKKITIFDELELKSSIKDANANTIKGFSKKIENANKENDSVVPTCGAVSRFCEDRYVLKTGAGYALKAGSISENFSANELSVINLKFNNKDSAVVSSFSKQVKNDNTSVPTGAAVMEYVTQKIKELPEATWKWELGVGNEPEKKNSFQLVLNLNLKNKNPKFVVKKVESQEKIPFLYKYRGEERGWKKWERVEWTELLLEELQKKSVATNGNGYFDWKSYFSGISLEVLVCEKMLMGGENGEGKEKIEILNSRKLNELKGWNTKNRELEIFGIRSRTFVLGGESGEYSVCSVKRKSDKQTIKVEKDENKIKIKSQWVDNEFIGEWHFDVNENKCYYGSWDSRKSKWNTTLIEMQYSQFLDWFKGDFIKFAVKSTMVSRLATNNVNELMGRGGEEQLGLKCGWMVAAGDGNRSTLNIPLF